MKQRTFWAIGIILSVTAFTYFKKEESAPPGMVFIPGGAFAMGCDERSMTDARPIHTVTVDGFWMDKTEVTNEQFEQFVAVTGYITQAERSTDKNVPPGSLVFMPTRCSILLKNCCAWWKYLPGACWRYPEGPGSTIKGREKHPVVHIAWQDAVAYAQWAGKRLPTEAEFEYAARGGLVKKRYSCGDTLIDKSGKWLVNIWQGAFPFDNTLEDGFYTTAPVGSFPANGYGLYDMTGNVWEWCQDWYHARHYKNTYNLHNPKGPTHSFDPDEPCCAKKVQRGGSFLCNPLYCIRYLVGARGKGALDTTTSHCGFRCVKSFS